MGDILQLASVWQFASSDIVKSSSLTSASPLGWEEGGEGGEGGRDRGREGVGIMNGYYCIKEPSN